MPHTLLRPRPAFRQRQQAPLVHLCWLVTLLALTCASAQEWRPARATYFGAPDDFGKAFDAARGEGSFGILTGGSCGFTNSDNTLPFPRDAVAAASDGSPEYSGSCGRCYAVRCRSGLVQTNDGSPLNLTSKDFIYLPSIAPQLTDTRGRRWPGNQAEAAGQLFTQCYNESKELVVRIIDSCPCIQVLPDGAPGVKPGGEVRRQEVCCGGPASIFHLDLSFWAFEQLAHPLFGQMMLEYKPVDCDSNVELPTMLPFIDRAAIYADGATRPGWGWFVYSGSYSRYSVPDYAPNGRGATCVQLAPEGGLSFTCKYCARPGLQPFAGAQAIRFWLKSDAQTADTRAVATPRGRAPDLKVFLLQDGDPDSQADDKFCNQEVRTGNLTAVATEPGGWFQFSVPLADFRCDYEGAFLPQIERIDFQNPFKADRRTDRRALFCLADLEIVREV